MFTRKIFFPVTDSFDRPWRESLQSSAYDCEGSPWSCTPDFEWAREEENPYVLGEFVWTGFDYLGEPLPYDSDSIAKSSYFGIMDLCGFPKDGYYLYRSYWNKNAKTIHLLPHWNWEGMEGKNIPVYCYTNFEKAELFVNGKSMGIRNKSDKSDKSRYRLMWDEVPYEAGKLKVVAYDKNDKVAGTEIIRTAGKPYKIRITPDRKTISCDGKDLSFVTIEILDKNGVVCPTAENPVFVEVSGNGNLRALCNGNPIDHTAYSSKCMRLFSGKLLAIVESTTGLSGDITIRVRGQRLEPATSTISVW